MKIPKRIGQALVITEKLETGRTITVQAENVRKERTGVHAKLSIILGETVLAWSTFNVERDEDRGRIVNSAQKMLPKMEQDLYPREYMKQDVDSLCLNLWELSIAVYNPELLTPLPTLTPISYILRPYLLKEAGTILFGLPGHGKSYLGQGMAIAVDAGVSDLWEVSQCKVLFINLERSKQSIQRRLGFVNAAFGLDPGRPLLTINARGKRLEDLANSIEAAVQHHHVGLIVIDSISRMGYGKLTEDEPVNRMIDTVNGFGVSWLALGHTPRADESHSFGSVMFDAGADVLVQASAEQGENKLGIGLQMVKANDVPKAPFACYALEFDEFGLSAMRKAQASEFPDIAAGRKMSTRELLMDFILSLENGMTTATLAAKALELNRSQLASLLAHDPNFTVLKREGHQVFYGVRHKQ